MSNPPRRTAALAPLVQPEEIDVFASTLARHREGRIAEKVFTELRLRYGTYGQRQDGAHMLRIKLPLGRVTTGQLAALADLAERFALGLCHLTTRQAVQVHFVRLDDVPEALRLLAAAGLTTREACGNAVRNVTCCPRAGVCADEAFDVSPHALALARFLLRHPDTADLGRKFKIGFSGCAQGSCGLAGIHDLGLVARIQDGVAGFEVRVGGGLGAVPMGAQVLEAFVPEGQLLPLAQAVCRVFARLGERTVRSRARLKFLVERLGVDAFRALVREERARLSPDPLWAAAFEATREELAAAPLRAPGEAVGEGGAALERFLATCARPQRQEGYYTVTVALPLGDVSAFQLGGLARMLGRYVSGGLRITSDQNLLLRWVSGADLPALHQDLCALGLGQPEPGTAADIVSCPGTDSCRLGLAASRGLASTLRTLFDGRMQELGGRSDVDLRISACPNGCGQHHLAAIGLCGSSKRKGASVAPVFQIFIGGSRRANAERFGVAVGKIPARRVPQAVRALVELYDAERAPGEAFDATLRRLGRVRMDQVLAPFAELPERSAAPDLYRDNRHTWDYVRGVGAGEGAGAAVSLAELMLAEAERRVFEAALALEVGTDEAALSAAREAMETAADALLSTRGLLKSEGYDCRVELAARFVASGELAAGTAAYLLSPACRDGLPPAERARLAVAEANLFVDEANVLYGRLAGGTQP